MRSDQLPPRGRRRYLDIAETLAAAITGGQLSPGTRLPSDRELSESLGVSRPTVREGLLVLELSGLIDVRHGSGTFVRNEPLVGGLAGSEAAESPRELIEARIAVEPVIAGLSAERVTKADVDRLAALIDEAQKQVRPDGDPAELVRLGLEFHRLLAASCGNRFLADFCRSLVTVSDHPLWMLLNRQAMLAVEARRHQVEAHRRVLEAVLRGDRALAAEAMRVHLRQVAESIGVP